MPSLRELQVRFARALEGGAAAADGLVLDDGRPAGERVAIYANNSRAAFRHALELTFPVTRRLGGDAWFAGAVDRYRAAHPSRSGDLQHAGEHFAAFVAALLAGAEHAVLADVAALEWACECVATAADTPPLDLAALATVPADRHGDLRFALPPACRLIASRWPVVDVWEANRTAGEPPPVDLATGPQYALVGRRDDVEVHRVDTATFAFVHRLEAGATLAAAVSAATAIEPAFPLVEVLPRLATLGLLGPARLDP